MPDIYFVFFHELYINWTWHFCFCHLVTIVITLTVLSLFGVCLFKYTCKYTLILAMQVKQIILCCIHVLCIHATNKKMHVVVSWTSRYFLQRLLRQVMCSNLLSILAGRTAGISPGLARWFWKQWTFACLVGISLSPASILISWMVWNFV